MAKQIDVLADWATSASTYGNSAIKPSNAKRQAGWVGGATPDVPPAPHINWLHKTAYENIAWLIDNSVYSDVARWEYMPLTGTFPLGNATSRFALGPNVANDAGCRGMQFAYDGLSAVMVPGSHQIIGGAATSFFYSSRDAGRSYQLNVHTALTGVRAGAVCYDSINSRFIFATTVISNQHCALKYTTDFGVTWASTEISVSNVDNIRAISFWPTDGRYRVIAFPNPPTVYTSASGTITGTYTQSSVGTSYQMGLNAPVYNNRYWMFTMSNGSNGVLVAYVPGGVAASFNLVLNGTVVGSPQLNTTAIFAAHYLPHNNTFVLAMTGSFCVLDGATGVPNGSGHWTSLVPSVVGNAMPGAGSFACVDWLQYDTRRQFFYAHVQGSAGLWTSVSLMGPWRQLPAYPSVASNMTKVLGASYLNDYFIDFDPYLEQLSSGASPNAAAMQLLAKRSFPSLY